MTGVLSLRRLLNAVRDGGPCHKSLRNADESCLRAAVDPAIRLVATELERRWNAALDAATAQERHVAGLATVADGA